MGTHWFFFEAKAYAEFCRLFFKFYFSFLVWGLCVHRCPVGPEEGVRLPGAIVTGGYKLPGMDIQNKLRSPVRTSAPNH